jgi:hypothetical protein
MSRVARDTVLVDAPVVQEHDLTSADSAYARASDSLTLARTGASPGFAFFLSRMSRVHGSKYRLVLLRATEDWKVITHTMTASDS